MSMYAIAITEKNLDLIEFLNDGVRPQIEEKPTYFICEIPSSHEITTKIEFEDDLYDEKSRTKDTLKFLL